MFDLEKSIAGWRHQFTYRRAFFKEDVDELERHLRDHVRHLVATGLGQEAAFHAAVRAVGDFSGAEDEYEKVYWGKVRQRRRRLREIIWRLDMLKNYFKIAVRTLRKYKGYTFINVTGLAVGMACCLFILLYVTDELGYDTYHTHADQIYRVTREWADENGTPTLQLSRISLPIAPALEDAFPEVVRATRLRRAFGLVSYGDAHYQEGDVLFAEADVFDVFTLPLVQGDPATALAEPYTALLSATTAAKYFGEEDPIGKVLRFDNQYDLRVTGIFEDVPSNAHVHFGMLVSFATLEALLPESFFTSWGSYNNYATYLLLAPGTAPEALEAKLPAFLSQHYEVDIAQQNRLLLQPLTDIHLHSHFSDEFEANGDIRYVYLFSMIAFIVLLIACVNFMNLATARSAGRAKEVGMRKALGAQRSQLIRQFLGESVLLAFLAVGVAVILVEAALPAFNDYAGKDLRLLGGDVFSALGVLLGIVVVVGALAGSYPAFFLSRFQPSAVLKGSAGRQAWRSRFRTVLVVGQFAVSIMLIVSVSVVAKQLDFIQNKRLGFDQEQLVALPVTSEMQRNFEATRVQLLTHPGVRAVTASQLIPSRALVNQINVEAEVGGRITPYTLSLVPVDHAFFSTYGVELAAGRDFSKERASDSTAAYVLNEEAVRQLGWAGPEEAVGKRFTMKFNQQGDRTGQVIGVVKDFHFESLHEEIAPLVFFIMPERYSIVTVKVAGSDLPGTLAFLEERWAAYRPNYPFTYQFVEESFDQLYQSERQLGYLFGLFATLAILIACLGLFGLASFVAEQRTKEIGVRKVLGSSVIDIVLLLTKDFTGLVLIAFVVAVPIAYLALGSWLEGFAYHTSLGVGPFVLAGGLAIAIAWLTVSYQSIKASLLNPVEALRYE